LVGKGKACPPQSQPNSRDRFVGPATRTICAREAASGRARTPIIALTANAMDHQVAESYAAGMDGFVPKPIAVGALYAAMNEALAAVEPETEAAQAG
jgi:CheY-like chemotaxis protein